LQAAKSAVVAESNLKSKEAAKCTKADEKPKDVAKGSKNANDTETEKTSKKNSTAVLLLLLLLLFFFLLFLLYLLPT